MVWVAVQTAVGCQHFLAGNPNTRMVTCVDATLICLLFYNALRLHPPAHKAGGCVFVTRRERQAKIRKRNSTCNLHRATTCGFPFIMNNQVSFEAASVYEIDHFLWVLTVMSIASVLQCLRVSI
jgi:hypothetical protein